MSDASKREGKPKWAIENPKLDNARRSRGIQFIDPKDEEFKDIMKIARRRLGFPMPAAKPCKPPMCESRENLAVVLENTRRNMLVLWKLTSL